MVITRKEILQKKHLHIYFGANNFVGTGRFSLFQYNPLTLMVDGGINQWKNGPMKTSQQKKPSTSIIDQLDPW